MPRRKIKTRKKSNSFSLPNLKLLSATLFLTIFGIIVIADVSSPLALRTFDDAFYFAKQQAVWAAAGFMLMIIASYVNYNFWKDYAFLIFMAILLLLLIVLIPGIGTSLLGARRWISVGNFNFQPSEAVKLALAMFVAKLVSEDYDLRFQFGAITATAALVMLQPDLGTTIVIVAIGFTQVFIAGAPILYLIGTAGFFAVLASLLVIFSDYRRQRLLTFLESLIDPLGLNSEGATYHIRQILIALGSGGLFGVGLGHSRQKHLFLPETATDSVFAVVAEEVGFLGATILIIMLTLYVLQLIKVAKGAPDKFSTVLATGIAVWIGGQMFLNIASMVALIPITGIPLPFLSYGGTSLTAMLFAIGIILNIKKHETT